MLGEEGLGETRAALHPAKSILMALSCIFSWSQSGKVGFVSSGVQKDKRRLQCLYQGSGGLHFSILEMALASSSMDHFATSSHTTQALAEKPVCQPSVQVPQTHEVSQGTKAHRYWQHNADDKGHFPSCKAAHCRLYQTQVLTGRPYISCRQVPNQHHFEGIGAVRDAPQLCLWDRQPPSRRQQLLPDSWSSRGQRVTQLLWGYPPGHSWQPAAPPPACGAAAISRRAASTQGLGLILPCAAWTGASSSCSIPIPTGCRLSPWTHPNHTHGEVRSGMMGLSMWWA